MKIHRRDFLRFGMTGLAVLSVGQIRCGSGGSGSPGTPNPPPGQRTLSLSLSITEALVEMIDGTFVYLWAFEDPLAAQPAPRIPGPLLEAATGDTIRLTITNTLDEDHAFSIPGVVGSDSGPIPPGQSRLVEFTAPAAGTYLYFDPLNDPVNRVLGLHGPMVINPSNGSNTPYGAPTPNVQGLFDDLGNSAHFPGEPWRNDPVSNRSRIWLFHSIDPSFHSLARAGVTVTPAAMMANFLPRYFTINGHSGVFASHDHEISPSGRIGQPHVVRILNAGLATHSPHLHANHYYVLAVNGVVQTSVLYLDTFTAGPKDRVDILIPFIRPPDIPGDPAIPLRNLIPNELALTIDGPNGSPGVPQSPLAFPMHCHVEMSQSAAGGNYPQGLVAHWEITGDVDGVDF
jgi:FtsP/CotA-like multicopper oxidase with cupredoxin domain